MANGQQRSLAIQKLEKEEAEAKAIQDSLKEVEIDRIRRSRDYEIKSHTVANNENMRMISRKYLAEPSKIYLFNPDALGSLKNGMILEMEIVEVLVIALLLRFLIKPLLTKLVRKNQTKSHLLMHQLT